MRAAVLYRIGAAVLVLFAVLHTIGFMNFKPPTAEGLAVRDAMANVRFEVKGTSFSYGSFYQGFGLFVTAYLLFSAFLAWHLATRPAPAIGWGLCVAQIACMALGAIYFSTVQASFCAVVAGLLGWATWRSQRDVGRPSLAAACL
jgi:hypothetical protein